MLIVSKALSKELDIAIELCRKFLKIIRESGDSDFLERLKEFKREIPEFKHLYAEKAIALSYIKKMYSRKLVISKDEELVQTFMSELEQLKSCIN